MQWLRTLFTPDERTVLVFLAAVLLVGSLLHVAGVYRMRMQGVEDTLRAGLAEDEPLVYDLRTATQEELETVPGIGPVTAQNILAWREEHTPARRSDLMQVRGIGPKTYERLAPYFLPLAADDTLPQAASHEADLPVDINRAGAPVLATLPGIGPSLAQAIVAWRDSVGAFATVDDLADVPGVGPHTLQRLRAHIVTGETL